jgi:hypothetical protein
VILPPQRLGRQAPDGGEALCAVVAVYSSHPTVPLSLHARVRRFGESELRRLEGGAALRLPAMRGSIHLLPRETARLAFRATAMTTRAGRLRYAGVCEERYDELKTVILEAAREPRKSRQLGVETGAGASCTPTYRTASTTRRATAWGWCSWKVRRPGRRRRTSPACLVLCGWI